MMLQELRKTEPWEWPAEASETVLAALSDSALPESDVLAALEMAGNPVILNEAVVEKLLSMAGDAQLSEEVRGQAAIAFGPVLEMCAELDPELDDPEDAPLSAATLQHIQTTLKGLHTDQGVPEAVRRTALEASVRAPQDWHRDAIMAIWSSTDMAWKNSAVFCMGYVRGFDEQILAALESDNEEMFYHAVVAAGSMGVEGAWSYVVPLLREPGIEKALLLAAIDTVACLRPQDAPMMLGDLLDSDDEDVSDAAMEAIELAEFAGEEGESEGPDWEDDGETFPLSSLMHEHECSDPSHHHHQPVVQAVSQKIGRNEPCPCASGKKYKKCCGK